ncbi:MAG: carbohydrate binding family 9 domain-containing protein, partial [Planctomycetota bacterium]|nr:carbohydrate binding family 9 domain-containing protein [Planctomycetota bacterium]
MIIQRTLAAGLAALCLTAAVAQDRENPAASEPFRVLRAEGEIRVDGELDEPDWKRALAFDLDFEVRPGENIPPPVTTRCYVTYDDQAIYFAFLADDPEPGSIRARYSDRDDAWNDDWVGVVLDTFNDQRRAYEMFSSPLGVQIDAINDETGGNYDTSWNAIWDSVGKIDDAGFRVEMRIPFSQIRFQATGAEQVWGFDAIRSYPRNDRHHITLFPRDRGANSYLSQTVKLTGFEGVSPGNNLEITPTLTATRTESREGGTTGDFITADSSEEVGATVRWGITPNLTLNGTLNPDFSQVEADAVQLDVNETFTLFCSETRPFFLEGADTFNTRLNLLNTRSIGAPDGALKLTGKQGRHTWGMLSARDASTSIILPGAEGSSGGGVGFENTSTIGRYRFDFGESSTVGATVADRRGAGYGNQVLSVDSNWRPTESDLVYFIGARSRTEYND